MNSSIRLERPWMPLSEDALTNGVKYSERDWQLMRLPRRARKANLEGIISTKLRNRVRHYLVNLRSIRFEGIGIFLSGPNGVGKSMALSIVLRAFYAHGQTSIYTTAYEILQARINDQMYTSDYRLWDYAQTCDVLFIDEVGSEHKSGSGFDSKTMENLIRSRYAENRITLLATNYSHKEWRDNYRQSLWSVVENINYCVALTGEDLRKKEHKETKGIYDE